MSSPIVVHVEVSEARELLAAWHSREWIADRSDSEIVAIVFSRGILSLEKRIKELSGMEVE